MSTENQLSFITNRSVTWDCMINQLTGSIQAEDAEYYVVKLMLQAPFHAAINESTFHYANSTK
jgi:hypothetical protein